MTPLITRQHHYYMSIVRSVCCDECVRSQVTNHFTRTHLEHAVQYTASCCSALSACVYIRNDISTSTLLIITTELKRTLSSHMLYTLQAYIILVGSKLPKLEPVSLAPLFSLLFFGLSVILQLQFELAAFYHSVLMLFVNLFILVHNHPRMLLVSFFLLFCLLFLELNLRCNTSHCSTTSTDAKASL